MSISQSGGKRQRKLANQNTVLEFFFVVVVIGHSNSKVGGTHDHVANYDASGVGDQV